MFAFGNNQLLGALHGNGISGAWLGSSLGLCITVTTV